VLADLEQDNSKLEEFNKRLDRQCPAVTDVTIRESVEFTLSAFDLIAVPVYMKNKAAEETARAYQPILEKTSEAILPFVAIQKQLRGSTDLEYKKHYLYLLVHLDIALQDVQGPSR